MFGCLQLVCLLLLIAIPSDCSGQPQQSKQSSSSAESREQSQASLDTIIAKLGRLRNSALEYSLESTTWKRVLNAPKDLKHRFTRATLDTANRLLIEGNYGQCEELCEAVAAIDPAWPHSFFLYGVALSHEGKLDHAIVRIRRAVKLAKQNNFEADLPSYYLELAKCLLQSGRDAEALEYCREAWRAAPLQKSFLESVYAVLTRLQDHDNAYDAADKLLSLSKTSEEKSKSLHLKALSCAQLQRLHEAEELCRQSVVLNSSSMEPRLTLMTTLVKLGRPKEGLLVADDFYRDHKAQLKANDLERIAIHLSEPSLALHYWKRAYLLDPKNEGYRRELLTAQLLSNDRSVDFERKIDQDIYAKVFFRLVAVDHAYLKAKEVYDRLPSEGNLRLQLASKISKMAAGSRRWEDYAAVTLTLCLLEKEPALPRSRGHQIISRLAEVSSRQFEQAIDTRTLKVNHEVVDFNEELIRLGVATPKSCYQLVLTYACSDELQIALQNATEFVRKYPSNDELRVLKAALQLRLGYEKQALDTLRGQVRKAYSVEDLRQVRYQWEPYITREKMFDRIWSKKNTETDTHLKREQEYFWAKASACSSVHEKQKLIYLAAKMSIAREKYQEALAMLHTIDHLDKSGYELKAWCLQALDRPDEAASIRQKVLELWKRN